MVNSDLFHFFHNYLSGAGQGPQFLPPTPPDSAIGRSLPLNTDVFCKLVVQYLKSQ